MIRSRVQWTFVLFMAAQYLLWWNPLCVITGNDGARSSLSPFPNGKSQLDTPARTLNLGVVKLLYRGSFDPCMEVRAAAAESRNARHVYWDITSGPFLPWDFGLVPAPSPSLAPIKFPALESSLPIQSVIDPLSFQQIPFLLKLAIVSFCLFSWISI